MDFVEVSPDQTQVGGAVRVSWTAREDGGPTIYLWYPTRGEAAWVSLGFGDVLFFRYHNEHVIAEDPEPTYEPAQPGRPWVLYRSEASELKEWVISRLTTRDMHGGELNWRGHNPGDLVHYRLIVDHDGYYDVIASGVGISERVADGPDTVPPPPPW